jgi:transposase-like protein
MTTINIKFDDELSINNDYKTLNSKTLNIEYNSLIQTYINGNICPHCHSRNIIGRGKYKNRKRYQCKECGKYFNNLTNSPFSGIHDLEKAKKYLMCLLKGYSIRKSARIVKISVSTAFNWRHKILNKINELPSPKMKELIEIEEIKIPFSAKGQRRVVSDEERKRKVSVLFACDRKGGVDSDSNYHIRNNKILNRLKDANHHKSIIVSQLTTKKILMQKNRFSSAKFATNIALKKTAVVKSKMDKWKTWMIRFHGVATKYNSNYLHWFDFLENSLSKDNCLNTFVNLLFHHPLIT